MEAYMVKQTIQAIKFRIMLKLKQERLIVSNCYGVSVSEYNVASTQSDQSLRCVLNG